VYVFFFVVFFLLLLLSSSLSSTNGIWGVSCTTMAMAKQTDHVPSSFTSARDGTFLLPLLLFSCDAKSGKKKMAGQDDRHSA
jgi:hypothetical protein